MSICSAKSMMVVGDGESLAITQGDRVDVFDQPFVEAVTFTKAADCFPRLELSLIVADGITSIDSGRKFLMKQAEKLTVRELLSVMHKKIEQR